MKQHLPDLFFMAGLCLSSVGIFYEFSPHWAAIYSGMVLLLVGLVASFRVNA